MTQGREPGTGGRAGDGADESREGAGDGLDAWLAANFPAEPVELAAPPAAAPPPLVPPAAAPPPLVPPAAAPPAPSEAAPTSGLFPPTPTEPPSGPPVGPLSGLPTGLPTEPPTGPAVGPAPGSPAGSHAGSPTGLPSDPPTGPAAEPAPGLLPPPPDGPPTNPQAPSTELLSGAEGSSGLDALFGETKFLEYDDRPSASENPFARKPIKAEPEKEGEIQPASGSRKPQPVLLWIAGSLLALLALGALFLLGTKLPALLGPAPGALVVPTSSPSPTSTEAPLGPVKPGVYQWDDLLGGECLDPYEGAWENQYTVVDCKKPHPAQLVARGAFPPVEGVTGYPGIEALQAQITNLCALPTGVDYSKATAYTDLQFEASYALSAQDWTDGNQFYYCYVSRSGGGELTGTIAVPQVAPTPAPSEQPAP